MLSFSAPFARSAFPFDGHALALETTPHFDPSLAGAADSKTRLSVRGLKRVNGVAKMKRAPVVLVALGLALAASPALAAANTLKGLGAALRACLAEARLAPGTEATVRFSLKRDGSLNGKPALTYAKLPKDEAERAADAAEITRAFDACLPLPITPALGAAIAGQPFTMRIIAANPT